VVCIKIVDVITYVISSKLEEPFAFSQGWVEKRSSLIVEIKTDEGISGWGESMCHGLQPPEIAASYILYLISYINHCQYLMQYNLN
jgi:D-galactarolactone cycloisomerase